MDENNYNRPDYQSGLQPIDQGYQPPDYLNYQGYQQPYGYQRDARDLLPPQYRPLSAWAYFGYSVLFSIPLVGLICLIVFSFNDSNINRRSFARSHWCMLLLGVVVWILIILVVSVSGIGAGVLEDLPGYYY